MKRFAAPLALALFSAAPAEAAGFSCLSAKNTDIVHGYFVVNGAWAELTPGQYHFAEGVWTQLDPKGVTVPGDGAVLALDHSGVALFWTQGGRACLPAIPISKRILDLLAKIKDGPLLGGDEI